MALDLEETTVLLRRTPGILQALLGGLPDGWIHEDEGPGTWSSFDVVRHLIVAEETNWIPRIRHLLRQGEAAPFPPFDRFAFATRWRDATVTEILDTFERARTRSLGDLAALGLTAGDLGRTGRHPDFGPVTLGQLLATWAIHDLNHLGQVVQVLARQHAEAVGPWRAFLGILDR